MAARVLGAGLRVLPDPLAAAAAERLFFTPPRPRRSRGEGALRRAERLTVPSREPVAAWRFGSGPAVLLLHGWGGRAAQLTSLVPAIVGRGYAAVAMDAPGHGTAGRGLSSAPQFARALRAVADAVGPVHGLVAHSLGAAAAALALRDGLRAERVAFLSPAADPPQWARLFARRLGLSTEVVARMRARSERRLGLGWDELRVPELARGMRAPLLVVHDRDDDEVPLADGAAIAAAWPGARLSVTEGLGHNRLLRDAVVAEQVAAFVASGARTCACGAPAAEDVCERCAVERELYVRDLRWPGGAAEFASYQAEGVRMVAPS
jgi:pimeloyl-ACP methyl ester carboxylesterase